MSYLQLLMKSPAKRLVDLYSLQNMRLFQRLNFTHVIERKVFAIASKEMQENAHFIWAFGFNWAFNKEQSSMLEQPQFLQNHILSALTIYIDQLIYHYKTNLVNNVSMVSRNYSSIDCQSLVYQF